MAPSDHSLAWSFSTGYVNAKKATQLATTNIKLERKIMFKDLQVIFMQDPLNYYVIIV